MIASAIVAHLKDIGIVFYLHLFLTKSIIIPHTGIQIFQHGPKFRIFVCRSPGFLFSKINS